MFSCETCETLKNIYLTLPAAASGPLGICKFLEKCSFWVATSEVTVTFPVSFLGKCVTMVCSIKVLLIKCSMFYLRKPNIYDGIFLLFTNSSTFLFFLKYLKCLSLTLCIIKRNHVWKYHLIFFFSFLFSFSFELYDIFF